MARPRTWTDDQFRRAVTGATSMVEVTQALGLWPGSRTNATLRRHAARLGLHLPNGWYRPRPKAP